jgi:hypothetical protein
MGIASGIIVALVLTGGVVMLVGPGLPAGGLAGTPTPSPTLMPTPVKAEFALTVLCGSGGVVDFPGEGTFAHASGATVDLRVRPDAGFQFAGWTGNEASIGAIEKPYWIATRICVTGDYVITANFVPLQ